MTVLEFLDSKGWKYTVKGKEAHLEECPFCHAKNRFNVNIETGAYICNRQNSCGAKGTFKLDKSVVKSNNVAKVKLGIEQFDTLDNKMLDYMQNRGISKETLKKARVLKSKKNGAFCFFYTDITGKAVGVKYRTIDKKIWSEEGSDMLLLNWDRVPDNTETLIITEGECFKGDVEVFTDKGFVKFEDLKKERIMQVKEDLTGEFVDPLFKVKKYIDDDLIVMKSGRNNWEHTSTKGHNMVINQKGVIKKFTAEKVSKGIAGTIPTAVKFDGEGTGLTKDEIALIIAISADSKCDVRKSGDNYFHFGLKKKRKILRLKNLLEKLNIKYTAFEKEYGYTTFNFKSSKFKKGLPEEWVHQMSLEEREFFIREIVEWDGNRVPNRKQYEFSSKLLHECEIVQAIAHTCGYMSTIMKRKSELGEWYKTSILLNKNSVTWQRDNSAKEKYKGYVYCATVPSGMILVRINGKITVTGNCDMLSFLEIGIENVVSVPNGSSNMEWIEKHYTWLEKFKTIILCYDNDEAGKKALKQSSERLSELNCELKTIDLLFYKDPNEILQDEGGAEKLKNIFSNNIKDVMQDNIIYASETLIEDDIQAIDWQDRGFNQLTGGCRYGEVMIITANSGAGKSTFANNMIANLLNQGFSVYTHQGEFRPGKFKSNLYKIMCRPAQIETYRNEFKNKIYGKISQITENKINDWLGDRLIIHGSQTPSKEELLRTMELVYKRHGVRFMFIDNLMTIAIDGQDKYEEQKQLLIQLQAFAKKYNVFICVVAHPKKNNASLEDIDQYVVSGASEIVNLANFVLYLKRLSDDEKEKLAELGIEASIGGVALKDREFGDLNKKEYWNYEIKTGRFLDTVNQNKSLEKTYNWENYEQIKKELDIEYPF